MPLSKKQQAEIDEMLDTLMNGNITDFFEWVDKMNPRIALVVGFLMKSDPRFRGHLEFLDKRVGR